MRTFIVICSVLAIAFAKPSHLVLPTTYLTAAPVALAAPVVPISSQFHAQDELGQYNYGYTNGLSAKTEIKSLDGVTRGSYSYVDAEGKLQSVEYSSDTLHGFRVAATNLPVAPVAPIVAALPQPLPVKDTPEVAEAKAKHLAALEEAKVRISSLLEVKSVPAEATVTKTAPVETGAEIKTVPAVTQEIKTVPILKALPTAVATPILTVPIHGYSYTTINSGLIGHPIISAYSAPWLAPIAAISPTVSEVSAPKVEAKSAPAMETEETKN